MNACELTILMPSLNEAETLSSCIEKAKRFLETEKINGEILIADNGSTDGTQAIAQSHGARVISVAKRGYGAALKSGMTAALGRYIIMGDADDSYDFLHLKPFLAKLREGYDLVMGNRFKGGIMQGAMPFLNRYVGNPILSYIGRLFYKSNIGDFHCGLRGFQRERFLQLNLQGDGMEFASEMVVKATLHHLRITEVPTQLFPDGRSRKPHLRPWRDGWRHLRLLFLFSPRWLFFYPGVFLMLLGFLLMMALSQGPWVIGKITLDIHTMLFSSMFMIVGLQAITFAIFSKFIFNANTHSYHFSKPVFKQGTLVGVALILLGIIGSSYGVFYWKDHAFGILIPSQMMRLLIPSMTAFILGMQCVLAGLFMKVLFYYTNSKS